MSVRVKGETYQDAAELVDTIGKLSAQALEMADGPERLALAAHIEELDSALRGYANGEGGTGEALGIGRKVSRPSRATPTNTDDPDDDEIAAQEGASFVCPLCNGAGELPAEPPQDPFTERCPICEGAGITFTGGYVEGHITRECKVCKGQGFRDKESAQAPPPDVNRTAADVPEALGALWNPERKNWDPPPGQQPPWVGAMWDSYYGKWA